MALATQTKILRVLQQGEIQRVGGSETIRVDVRILAATNKDLEAMVKAKTFREDLYYRLNVVRIRMPALRDRAEDIPQIVDFCLQNLVKNKKTRVGKVSPEALAVLTRYGWPGNVRELENMIYRSAVIAQGDSILLKDLPPELRGGAGEESAAPGASAAPVVPPPAPVASDLTVTRALEFLYTELGHAGAPVLPALEKALAQHALAAANGDEDAAAAKLGVTKAAWKKLRG